MKFQDQQRAAKAFVERWRNRGDEKQDCQSFWLSLLGEVLAVPYPSDAISFEKTVDLGKDAKGKKHTGFIDGYIPSTKVLIEQKGAKIDLKKAAAQSDGTELTPYQQAKRYADRMTNDMRPRWIVVSNFQEIHVYDLNENLDVPAVEMKLADLEKEAYRLDFLVDKDKVVGEHELQVSLKAGELVGKLYDALEKQYAKPMTPEAYQSLNKLCVRLVFCLYAEDSGLFDSKSQFHDYLVTQGKIGVGRIHSALRDLFRILNTKDKDRDPYEDAQLNDFPYVNGGLFADDHVLIPPFSEEAFNLLVTEASAKFDWSEISPTIFGAVFESTLNAETRRQGGMHYTSIENIHKVIDPLFLDDLRAEFETLKASVKGKTITSKKRKEFQEFQQKLGRLTFLDPACGSGNFLTETYLSLRRLENDVLRQIYGGQQSLGDELSPICVHISQFYGIEINDFAAVVAKTALWIAESQMMKQTREIVSVTEDFLPLKSAGHIVEGNALRMDWNDVIPAAELNYIMGNPPFVGYDYQTPEQKKDIADIFIDEQGKPYPSSAKSDYVSMWFFKAAQYIGELPIRIAFVATNSITQGEQVAILWKALKERFGCEIDFAHRTFCWDSETTDKAHVHCVIIGFGNLPNERCKTIYTEDSKLKASHINGYLLDGDDVFLENRKTPIDGVSEITKGSQPTDDGNFYISEDDYEWIKNNDKIALKYVRNIYGAYEFIRCKPRRCLWLVNCDASDLKKSKFILGRLDAIRAFRLKSPKKATVASAKTPYLFQEIRQPNSDYLIVPSATSERRQYVPMGFMHKDIIASNLCLIIPDAQLFHFGVLNSSVHMAWMRVVCGRLKSDYRYSASLVYNNFIWPKPTESQRLEIKKTAQAIIDARANHPESSLADLYDDLTMPADLRKAHKANDRAVMKAYGFKSSMTESEIVAELFKLYQKKVGELATVEAQKSAEEKTAKKPQRRKKPIE